MSKHSNASVTSFPDLPKTKPIVFKDATLITTEKWKDMVSSK